MTDTRQRLTKTYTVVFNTTHVPDLEAHLAHLFESWLRSKGAKVENNEIEI